MDEFYRETGMRTEQTLSLIHISRVDHNGHVRVDILDFLAVKEALATHNAVRDTGTGKISCDGVGLRIHAVQNGMVF